MRPARTAALILLLVLTVLTALWSRTSAILSPGFIPGQTTLRTPAPTPSPNPAGLSVVVNKQNALSLDYVPPGLVTPQVATRYNATAEQSHLRTEAARAMEAMFAAANNQNLQLVLVSGYRSSAYQAAVYNNAVTSAGRAVADQAVARPGHSEHQTGLGADIGRLDGVCDIANCFGDTAEGSWIKAHTAEYGFIIRYPEGKATITGYDYEPWHLRYVGQPAAQAMAANNQTLEEFFHLPAALDY